MRIITSSVSVIKKQTTAQKLPDFDTGFIETLFAQQISNLPVARRII